jgi:hypothetical protein
MPVETRSFDNPGMQVHRTLGEAVVLEVAQTAQQSHALDLPVLWDFRESTAVLRIDSNLSAALVAAVILPGCLGAYKKRAFLVTDAVVADELKSTLAAAPTPWPWSVCQEMADATSWLLIQGRNGSSC